MAIAQTPLGCSPEASMGLSRSLNHEHSHQNISFRPHTPGKSTTYPRASTASKDAYADTQPRAINAILYRTGTPLYTRENLLQVEAAAGTCGDVEYVALPAYGGGKTVQKVVKPPPDPLEDEGDERMGAFHKTAVVFLGHRELVGARAGGPHTPAAPRSPWQLRTVRFRYDRTACAGALAARLAAWLPRWRRSAACARLRAVLDGVPRGVGGADRLVCFGLGSLQGAGAAGDTGRLDQYAAALTMAEVLGARWRAGGGAAAGAWSCRVMAQDPAYTPVDEAVLRLFGIEVIGRRGAAGFAEIDEQTAVFTMFPSARVTEIIADVGIPRPAVYACDHFSGGEFYDAGEMTKMDPDSPRVREMALDYKDYGMIYHDEENEPGKGVNFLRINARVRV